MNVTQNSKRPMVQVRVFIEDPAFVPPPLPVGMADQNPVKTGAIMEFTLALDAEEFTRACMAIHNVGVFVEHNGENVWYPPRSIVKVIEVKKAMVS